MSRNESDWLTATHLAEIAAAIVEEHATRDFERVSGAERVTSRNLRITVNRFAQPDGTFDHLVTLAGVRTSRVVLENIAELVQAVLDVDARLHSELSHVTLVFTMDTAAEETFRARVKDLATAGAAARAVDALLLR